MTRTLSVGPQGIMLTHVLVLGIFGVNMGNILCVVNSELECEMQPF